MSHQPVECDHLFGGWQPVLVRVGDDEVFRHWQRQCLLCSHLEEYGQVEAPPDDRP